VKILITGATDGLGKGIAAHYGREGATLLLHGRDEARGAETIREIGSEGAFFYRADFASLEDVRRMGERILDEHDGLDALVNNAGIGTTLPGDGARMESADGHELRFQVNYLSSFLLTRMLEPLLNASAPARVVSVSSAGQMPIDFDDLMLEHDYNPVRAYCQSKLAQVMFTFDLAERLRDRGVSATCLHPASYMPTKIVLHARGAASSSLEEGIEATARLISDPELAGVTGRYFDRFSDVRADPQAYDLDARRRLREVSELLVGLTGARG
jgi:NAD(P)-dependent dehydrogenase (short-subunit alcohol dehydrogenase family)